MRTIRVLLAAFLGALAVVALTPAPSYACSCATAEPVSQYADWADVVLVGTVEERVEPAVLSSSADPAVLTLSVDRVLKGGARVTQQVLSPVSGASCGLENVEVGRSYVVFASHRTLDGEPTDALWSLLCDGTRPASPGFVAAIEAATGPGSPPDTGTAHASQLTVTFGRPAGQPLAVPLALGGGGALALLAGSLWLRLRRS